MPVNKQSNDEQEKNKPAFKADNLLLCTLTVFDNDGNEENAIAHGDDTGRSASKQPSFQPVVSMKKLFQTDDKTSYTKCNCA